MDHFKPGRFDFFIFRIFIFFYNLRYPKQAYFMMKYNRKFNREARIISRANRIGKASEEMIQQAQWAKVTTRRLFSSKDSVVGLLRKRLSFSPSVETNVSLKNRIQRVKECTDILMRINRQGTHANNESTDCMDNEELVQNTIHRVIQRNVTTQDLIFDFKPASYDQIHLLVATPGKNPFFDKLIRDLNDAQSHINIIMYGFRDPLGMANSTAARIANILCEKAQQGVEVNLLLDGIGSGLFGFRQNDHCRRLILKMFKHGINCIFNNPWNIHDEERLFRLDHRKQYIIDGRIAYVGGMGIEDQFDNNSKQKTCHDAMVRVEGEIVRQFQCSFLSSFTYQYIKNHKIKRFPLSDKYKEIQTKYFPDHSGKSSSKKATLLQNIPVANHHQITQKYHQLIDEADNQICFMNPYCTEDSFVRSLKRWTRTSAAPASDNKVSWLLLPGEIRDGFVGLFKRFELPGLIFAGVNIALYKIGFLHGKVAIQDQKRFMIGSCNLDAFSMWRNWESALYIEDSALAVQLQEKIFCFEKKKENYSFLSLEHKPTCWEKGVCKLIDLLDRFW